MSKWGLALRGAGLGLGVLTAGLTIYQAVQARAAENDAIRQARVDGLTESYRAQADSLVSLVDQSLEYINALKAQNDEERSAAEGDTRTPSQPIFRQIIEEARNTGDSIVELLSNAFGDGIGFSAERLIRERDQIDALQLATLNPGSTERLSPGDFDQLLTEGIDGEQLIPELRQVVAAAASGEFLPSELGAVLNAYQDIIDANSEYIRQEEERAISGLQDLALEDPRLSQEDIDKLVEEARSRGSETPNIDVLAELTGPGPSEIEQTSVAVSQTIEQLQRFVQANVISGRQFVIGVREEVARLQTLYDAALAAGNLEQASELAAQLNETKAILSAAVRDEYDALEELAQALGFDGLAVPLGGVGSTVLQKPYALARNADIRNDPQAVAQLVVEIAEFERTLLEEQIARYDNVQAAALFAERNAGNLSEELQSLVIQRSLDIQAPTFAAGVGLDSDSTIEEIEAIYGEIGVLVEGGKSVRDAAVTVIRGEIEVLERLLTGTEEGTDSYNNIIAQLSALKEALRSVLSDGFVEPDFNFNVGPTPEEILQDRIDQQVKRYEQIEELLGGSAAGQGLGGEVSRAINQLDALRGINAASDEAIDQAVSLVQLVQQVGELSGAERQRVLEVIAQQTGLTFEALQALGDNSAVYAAMATLLGGMGAFANGFVISGVDVLNVTLDAYAKFIDAGVDAADALLKAVNAAIIQLRLKAADVLVGLQQSGADLSGAAALGAYGNAGPAAADINAAIAEVEQAIGDLSSIDQLPDFANIAEGIGSVGGGGVGVAPPSGGGGGGGGGGGDSIDEELERILAWYDYIAALYGRDPVAVAQIAIGRAQVEIDRASDAVERIKALTRRVQAEQELADAIQEVYQAQQELAIAVAQDAGDVEGALRIALEAARQQLRFLREQGAGDAEIAQAEIGVIEAARELEDGIINTQLEDLDFFYEIGELTTEAYVAALRALLATLDPIADRELWRDITLQIQRLQDSASDLQTNLPTTFELPSVFQVRRLNQFGNTPFPGVVPVTGSLTPLGPGASAGGGVNITINVQTGMDWEEAKEEIARAIGQNSQVFSVSTRKY